MTRICVFLMLGAIVNVAVAWGLAWFTEMPLGKRKWAIEKERNGVWYLQVSGSTWGGAWIISYRMDVEPDEADAMLNHLLTAYSCLDIVPAWTRFQEPTPAFSATNAPSREERIAQALGFPALTLWSERQAIYPFLQRPPKKLMGGIEVNRQRFVSVRGFGEVVLVDLPLRPIWPGFAVNTLFYAAILWGLFSTPGRLRRTVRRRRGLCPACGYPIGTNDVCTECGAAISGLSPQGGDGM